MNIKAQIGLTLIEVLIASMILFMTLGVVSAIFQQNIASQQLALKYVSVLDDYSSVVARINFQLETTEQRAGSMQFADDNVYEWSASVVSSASGLTQYSPEAGAAETAQGVYILYEVTVTDSKDFSFNFRQLVWKSSAV